MKLLIMQFMHILEHHLNCFLRTTIREYSPRVVEDRDFEATKGEKNVGAETEEGIKRKRRNG
jgi:hypothetical protein